MEQIDRECFGIFLSELRKEKCFTQQELAERLFVSNKAVSKWERGQSLPDISLLMPLAELLGVSVAELLKGERLAEEALDSCEVKELVNKALQLSAEERERGERSRRFWRRAWVVCTALAAVEVMLLVNIGRLTALELWDYLMLVEALTLGFGAYFCFAAKERLPAFYDENSLNYYSDGWFRMNIPGVRFNNSNWPHILRAARAWLLGTAVVYPPVFAAARVLLPAGALLGVTLFACLSFFIPIMAAAKKHE